MSESDPTVYASVEDIQNRMTRDLTSDEKTVCAALLEDAAALIDAAAPKASPAAKKLVSCRMVLRTIGTGGDLCTPVGATQGTVSALGYSQTWTVSGGGTTGELYFNRMDKRMLGLGDKIGASNPLQAICPEPGGLS